MFFAVILEDMFRMFSAIFLIGKYKFGFIGSSIVVGSVIGLIEAFLFGPTFLAGGMELKSTFGDIGNLTILLCLVIVAVIFRPIIHSLLTISEVGYYKYNKMAMFLVILFHLSINSFTMIAVPQIDTFIGFLAFSLVRNLAIVLVLLMLCRKMADSNIEFRTALNDLVVLFRNERG